MKEVAGEAVSEGWRKTQTAIAGFEDGRGPRAKECRQTLESGKGKEMTFPPEPPEGTQSY